jgi:hypothetical protein
VAEVTVEIGGLRTTIATTDPDIAAVVTARYAGFLTSAPGDWRIEAGRRAEGLVPLTDVTVHEDGRPDRLVIERHDFLATLDLGARAGRVALGAVDHVAVDTFLRVTYSLALLEARALLVHAASLARQARAWIFSGPSGSGKTTLARLSPDAALLSDEISIVRVDDDHRVRCYGSPFWGELGKPGVNTALPVAAIHFLRHAERHAATPLTALRALQTLLPNVLFFAAEPGLVARVLDVAAELVASVPCFALGFRPEPAVWEVIAGA